MREAFCHHPSGPPEASTAVESAHSFIVSSLLDRISVGGFFAKEPAAPPWASSLVFLRKLFLGAASRMRPPTDVPATSASALLPCSSRVLFSVPSSARVAFCLASSSTMRILTCLWHLSLHLSSHRCLHLSLNCCWHPCRSRHLLCTQSNSCAVPSGVRAAVVPESGRCTRARVSCRVEEAARDISPLVGPQARFCTATKKNQLFSIGS